MNRLIANYEKREKLKASNYLSSDGGKHKSGFDNERNDCVVRTLSNASCLTYIEAYALAARFGRAKHHGMRTYAMNHMLGKAVRDEVPELSHLKVTYIQDRPKTVRQLIERYSTGTYFVSLNNHVFVLSDGKVLDSFFPRLGRRITDMWRFELK